jgi:phosphate starvation-inducible membrane PsiE
MKTLDLNALGIREMNTDEMQMVDGGSLVVLAVCCVVALVASSCATYKQVATSNDTREYQEANDSIQLFFY